jgi:hypothetical protein
MLGLRAEEARPRQGSCLALHLTLQEQANLRLLSEAFILRFLPLFHDHALTRLLDPAYPLSDPSTHRSMHKYESVCIHGIERFLVILIVSSGGQPYLSPSTPAMSCELSWIPPTSAHA